jgi:hypothetical protein
MHKRNGLDDYTPLDHFPGLRDNTGKATVGDFFLEIMSRFGFVYHIIPHGLFKKVQSSRFEVPD